MLATLVTDEAPDCIVRAAHPTLGLELNVGHHARLGAAYVGVVAKLVLHCTEQDSAHVDVGLCDEAAPCQPWSAAS